jgi:hypothetical protein
MAGKSGRGAPPPMSTRSRRRRSAGSAGASARRARMRQWRQRCAATPQTRVPRTGVTCPETRLLFALERAVRVRSHVQWLPALAAALCARVRCPALTILHHSSDPTPLLPAVDARACPATQAPRVSDVGVATTTTRSARAFQRAAACSSNLQPRAGTPRPRRPRPRLARAPTATCAAATLR